MVDTVDSRMKFVVPGGRMGRRGLLKWVLLAILVLAVAGALNRGWINFQFHVAMTKLGSTETRAQSLRWFIQNNPEKAKPVFFEIMLEEPELRHLAVTGLLKSDQQELIPVYLRLWRDKSTEPGLRDAVLELIADHSASRGLFLFTDPSMVLSAESRYWGLAYDYLNANSSPELVDFLVSRYYAGDARTREASVCALSYLKANSVLDSPPGLRSMLINAMESGNARVRFRAVQAFSSVASVRDIPTLLLVLREYDRNTADAAGRLLRYLGRRPASSESAELHGLKELALAAAAVQERGYAQEIEQQLGFGPLARLWGLILCGRHAEADELAARLAQRARGILTDIATTKRISFWNRYELSTVPAWLPGGAALNRNFGATVRATAGKLNYGQILSVYAGRVIYCADVEAWERDYHGERERFLQHRKLAQKAGLEQVIRVEIAENVLDKVSMFSSAFSHILSATRYGEGAGTSFFEISLKPGIDPAQAYREYATLFREAAISARRLDSAIRLFVGPVELGDRRWYGAGGAIEELMHHSFEDGERFRRYVGGVSIAARLPLGSLETELAEFGRSFALAPRGALLWCTSLGQPFGELRSTAGRLERDFTRGGAYAAGLPASVSTLALAGVRAIFFDPLKDMPVPDDPRKVRVNGLLYADCMPKPAYHTASMMVHALAGCDLSSAHACKPGPGAKAVRFSGGSRSVVIAWPESAPRLARIEVKSPFVRVTDTIPDAIGNFRSRILETANGKVVIRLDRGAVIVEQHENGPAAPEAAVIPGELEVMAELSHLWRKSGSCLRSYGSHDRSEGNDDGFTGTTSYLYRRGNGEYVIFDARGPGVLERLWLGRTDYISRIRFYFDGAEQPGIDMTPDEMFSGKELPFKYPLAASGESAGGGCVLFVPIQFSKRLVIATVGEPRFCQADYSLLEPDAAVENSTADRLKAQGGALAALARQFVRETKAIHANCSPYSLTRDVDLPPGQKVEVAKLMGPGLIRCLRVACANESDMEYIILQIHWDGSDTAGVGSPLADLFGQKHGQKHWQGHPVGYMSGEGYIHYPMPFAKSARVVMTNTGSKAARASLSISTTTLVPSQKVQRYFCCHWKTAIAGPGQRVKLLSVKGAGHFAGCVLSIYTRGNISYLDSDVLIFADDAGKPLVHSTGIDDYFGGGNFYEGGQFSLPYCGLIVRKDATTVQYRFNSASNVTFEKSLSFKIEELPAGIRQTVFSGAFFWYSESPAGGDYP